MPTPREILAVTLPLLAGIALLALASLVLRKGGRHLHARLFGALFLLSGVKSIGDAMGFVYHYSEPEPGVLRPHFVADFLNASSPLFPDAAAWLVISQACALAMLPLLFAFCASFPHPAAWMRRPGLVIAAAFVPSVVVGALVFTADGLALAVGEGAFDLVDILVGFNLVASGMTLTALVLLLRARVRSPDHIERQQATYVALGFLPSFLATWVIAALFIGYNLGLVSGLALTEANEAILHFLSPVFETLAAGLVGFAILKYNILGVKPGFRVGVKSAVVGFVFVLVFLVTQGIENIVLQGQLFAFAGEYGSFLLSGTTSVVLFKPIERLSGKVSDRLLPRPAEGDAALARAAEVYHAQCTYVLRDGNVSEREMAFLRNLRGQLGLTDAQARAIEEKVERILKVDAPQTGATAQTAVRHVSAAHEELAQETPEVRRASPLPAEPPAPVLAAAPLAAEPTPTQGAEASAAVPTPPAPPPKAGTREPPKPPSDPLL